MTPGARIAAAIDALDRIAEGQPAEQVLTRWARASRYAGSGDRAAIRDHVYDALRHWRSDAIRGGGTSGRARMIGRLRATGQDIDALFCGIGHAPDALSVLEAQAGSAPKSKGERWDLPDWLVVALADALGPEAEASALALTQRAPVTLRVNRAHCDWADAQARLRADGVETVPNPRAETALTITAGPRRVRTASSYATGLVELQDAASQAAMLGISGSGRALDYCAGGGGKALALAALGWRVTAHDIDSARMSDLSARASRGGHEIAICPPEEIRGAGCFDLVLCDAPCSGSGTWRRTPQAKWTLTPARLQQLMGMQMDVLESGMAHVGSGGRLVYATCSVLRAENNERIDAFLQRHPNWRLSHVQTWPVDAWGDGFFVAHLDRP